MRRLFVKIFAWFWLTIALVVGVIAVLTFTQTAPPPGPPRLFDDVVAVFASTAAETLDTGGAQALEAYLQRIEAAGRIHAYMLDERGAPLLGRTPPPAAIELLSERRREREGSPPSRFTGQELIVASPTTGPSGRRYTLVLTVPAGPRPDLFANPWLFALRLLAVVATAGLVCFALARYLASPIVKLRHATARLAEGDLTTRVTPSLGRRRDELTSLGRDFDFMAEQIEALVTSQRTLLGDISHELRSPLARLSVALELARRRSGPEATDALDRIERESERLNEMIGRLLTLTRLDEGAAEATSAPVDLAALVESVASDADFEARATDRSVECVRLDPCTVRGDEALLLSAVENVVRNAMRYTRAGTAVEIELRRAEREATLVVRDHGEGVPEAALGSIFRPFYRVADARDRRSGGVGLGLAIVERAIRLHGGSVRAANASGGGLSVEIRLPVTPA